MTIRPRRKVFGAVGVCLTLFAVASLVGVPSAQQAAADSSYNVVPNSGRAPGSPTEYLANNAAQGIRGYFTDNVLRVVSLDSAQTWSFELTFSGYGHAGALLPVGKSTMSSTANRVEYVGLGDLTEWYLNGPDGVEQWFSLATAPPAGADPDSPLIFQFGLTSGLTPRLTNGTTALEGIDASGNVIVRYDAWQAYNSLGKALQTDINLVTDGNGVATGVEIAVAATPADYPINVGMGVGTPKALKLQFDTGEANTPLTPETVLAPGNDDCVNAITITETSTCASTSGDSTAATQQVAPSTCSGFTSSTALEVWYKFVATTTAATIQVTGTGGFDAIVELRSGACTGTAVSCSDNTTANGVESIAATGLTIGTTYLIRVYGWGATTPTGTFGICVFQPAAPANDTCAGAAPLTLNQTFTGTNAAATNDYSITSPTSTCFPGVGQTTSTAVGRDTVWSFTPGVTGKYSFKAQTTDASGGGNLVLYDTTTCPAPGAFACTASLVGANRNSNTAQYSASEEIYCQTLTAGTTYYVFVDESTAATTGGAYTIEVADCFQETEPNDTPATANTYGFNAACPTEGTINPANNFDYFSIGTPAAGSRVFALEDGVSANTTDQRLRITTATDTLEFDDDDNTTPWGSLSANIAGRALTGAASYIQVSPFSTTTTQEPYRLYAVVQPPGAGLGGSSAAPETNDSGNNTLPGAEVSGKMFFSGTYSSTTDLDSFRFCAAAGDLIYIDIDADPLRDLTPVNPAVFLFDSAGNQLLGFTDADASSSNTSGAGSLTATSPNSPGEGAVWRARYTGTYYAGTNLNGTALGTNPDYLISIADNCQTGSQQSADLSLTKTDLPDPVVQGQNLVYTLTMSNAGPNIALDATLTDALPAGTTFVSITGGGTGGSWNCVVPAVGSGGTLTCTNQCFTVGGSFTFTLTVNVAAGCPGISNTATASSLTADPNLANNSPVQGTTVSCDDGNPCTIDACGPGGVCTHTGVVCDDNNVCTSDSCNLGTGLCDFVPVAAGTACGDPSSGQCDNPDTCDGSGACQVNHVADGTNCGDAGTECINQDTCLAGVCHDNGFKPAGYACGDPSHTECDNPDTCDGAGVCQPNHEPATTTCGDAGTECTNQDYCNGSGGCTDNGFKAAGTACGDPSSGQCDAADSCDGSGTCLSNHAADGTNCGDTGTECVNQDTCFNGACHDNGFKPSGTACGDPSDTVCDKPDTCDGGGFCQPNYEPTTTTCGDAGTECTNQDYCNGAGGCTDNGFKAAGTACGDPSSGACDAADSCNGSGSCLSNHATDGTNCGDAGTECINQDTCLAGVCHDNGFKAAGTACGDPTSGQCDAADSCNGAGSCLSNHATDGTNCGDAGTECVNQDTCVNGACQDNGFKPSGTACGDGTSGECDNADTCNGAGSCQPNHKPDGTNCGDAGTQCTNQDTCQAGVCHDNGFKPAGTACGNGSSSQCDNADTCNGAGTCLANNLPDGTLCGDAGTQCTNQDTCLAGVCHDNGTQPDGTPCDDGNSCTTGDACHSGICSGDNTALGEPNPETNGYYKRLCHGPHSGDQLTAADAACTAQVAPLTFGWVTSVSDICGVIEPSQPNNDKCQQSEDDLMVLALNICKAKVCQSQSIDSQCGSNKTVGQSLLESDAIFSNPNRTADTCQHGKCLDEEINTGRALEMDTLTLSREGSNIRMNWNPPYLNDGTGHPTAYHVWRRVAGSMAAFTLIDTVTPPTTTYLDTDAGTTAWEYEITSVFD